MLCFTAIIFNIFIQNSLFILLRRWNSGSHVFSWFKRLLFFICNNSLALNLKLCLVQLRQTITVWCSVVQKKTPFSLVILLISSWWILLPDLIPLQLRAESKSWVFLADKNTFHWETKSCSAAGVLQLPLKKDGGRIVSDGAEFRCCAFTVK